MEFYEQYWLFQLTTRTITVLLSQDSNYNLINSRMLYVYFTLDSKKTCTKELRLNICNIFIALSKSSSNKTFLVHIWMVVKNIGPTNTIWCSALFGLKYQFTYYYFCISKENINTDRKENNILALLWKYFTFMLPEIIYRP